MVHHSCMCCYTNILFYHSPKPIHRNNHDLQVVFLVGSSCFSHCYIYNCIDVFNPQLLVIILSTIKIMSIFIFLIFIQRTGWFIYADIILYWRSKVQTLNYITSTNKSINNSILFFMQLFLEATFVIIIKKALRCKKINK